MQSGQQAGCATFVAAAMLLGVVPFVSACGGKSASEVARSLQKAGLSTEQLRLGVCHYSDTTLTVGSSGPSVSTRFVPALVAYMGSNRATLLFAHTEDQATDDGAAPVNPVSRLTDGTLTESYGDNVVIWQRKPAGSTTCELALHGGEGLAVSLPHSTPGWVEPGGEPAQFVPASKLSSGRSAAHLFAGCSAAHAASRRHPLLGNG